MKNKKEKQWRFKGKFTQESADLRRFNMARYRANQANLIYY